MGASEGLQRDSRGGLERFEGGSRKVRKVLEKGF